MVDGPTRFVLEVDERTPPVLVPDGDRFRLERFPLGTRVIYPAESLTSVPGLGEAINALHFDAPIQSEPLQAAGPAMRLTIAFDDIGTPTPTMRRPDIRGKVIEAVLTRAAQLRRRRCAGQWERPEPSDDCRGIAAYRGRARFPVLLCRWPADQSRC